VVDIQQIIRALAERDIGVLITDHNVRETLGVCARAYIVDHGSVIADGSAEQILANPRVREVYLGETFRM
jgi:lipopolysaccharide export system ATP-binding protein